MDTFDKEIYKTRMKTIIEGSYRLTETDETVAAGIVGQVGRVRKAAESAGRYWVQVGEDVYDLSIHSLDPRIVTGLYDVNYGDIVSSELFSNTEVVLEEKSVGEIAEELRSYGLDVFPNISKDHKVPSFGFNIGNVSVRISAPSYITVGESVRVFIRPDKTTLADEVERLTGKNLWDLVKISSLMELPMCTCGSCQQSWEEWRHARRVRLVCADCGQVLYIQSVDDWSKFDSLEPALARALSKNKRKSLAYTKLVEQMEQGGSVV